MPAYKQAWIPASLPSNAKHRRYKFIGYLLLQTLTHPLSLGVRSLKNDGLEELIDRIYVKMELLEGRVSLIAKGDDKVVIQVLDILNQVYDLLAELRRGVRSRCV
jgi:hypothetical protein